MTAPPTDPSSKAGRLNPNDDPPSKTDKLLSFTDMKIQGLPREGVGRKYRLSISVGDRPPENTEAVRPIDGTIEWSDPLYISDANVANSDICFDLYKKHKIQVPGRGKYAHVGRLQQNVEVLLSSALSINHSKEIPVIGSHSQYSPKSVHISFTTSVVNPRDRAVASNEKAKEAVDDMRSPHHGSDAVSRIEDITTTATVLAPVTDICTSLLEKLKILESVVSTISEIHPYAKMAFNVLDGVYKAIVSQMERDQNIKDLLSVMNSTFDFVAETDALLEKVQSQKDIVTSMVQQTTECGYFLQKYARDKNFATRLAKNLLTTVDTTIEGFKATFKELIAAFNEHAVLQTQIKVVQIMSDIHVMGDKVNLLNMPYAAGARYQRGKSCLLGTRQEILDEITDWVNDMEPSEPRAYLLTGAAGTGKSAIAHTIARRFDDIGRLGSSFCFSKDVRGRTPDKLFSTMARDLADQEKSGQFMAKLSRLDISTMASQDVTEQFEKFLLDITKSLDFTGPLLFVIDGLDESTEPRSRQTMLQLLSRKTRELPANFRFLITSRPEDDIVAVFEENRNTRHKRMDSLPDVDRDIRIYIKKQLTDDHGRFLSGLDESMCDALACKAEGLFQWAYVACATIRAEGKGGLGPRKRYHRLMTADVTGLDGLYRQVLSDTFDDDADVMDEFRHVLGLVLASYEPLSLMSLQELCDTSNLDEHVEVSSILKFMGSLLTGVEEGGIPVKPLHTSFRDFLTNQERSQRFYIRIGDHQCRLCLASLRVMTAGLRFNICGLETSHIRNRDVPDLESRVSASISPTLSYACRSWGLHLQQTDYNTDIRSSLEGFLHTSLLYWFETLSLLDSISVARVFLLDAARWIQKNDPDLARFSTDGASFINVFAPAIAASAPHTYISGLPLAPKQSLVRSSYLPEFQQTVLISQGHVSHWHALQTVMRDQGSVMSVAFSPNGKQVASGSSDRTIRVWNVETGEVVSGPYVGHEDWVNSVAFSPDGKRAASGSQDRTIRVWDVQTGEVVLDPFIGHEQSVTSVAFSPDCKRVASGSDDKTVRIWDVETGKIVSGPYVGHEKSVTSVAFSPDGQRVASGSDDETVRMWDVTRGKMMSDPYIGHEASVTSVAFSPDGKQVASGSQDETVLVWDVEAGKMVSGPYVGHEKSVTSVAFSPNGKRVASGSDDETIRIWDIESGKVVSGPYVSHESWITSVAFSPDGKRVASGAFNDAVEVWDVEMGEEVSVPYTGHENAVRSVAFSLDGKRVASGSSDRTIRVWDAQTGEVVSGPYIGHKDSVTSVAFSPDGKRVVSGSQDRTIRVWDVESDNMLSSPYIGHDKSVMSVAFFLDGKRVASGSEDKTIRVWDIETGEVVLGPCVGHEKSVTSIALSLDGKRMASGSGDRTIRIWDVETGEMVSGPYIGHQNWVSSVTFSPDGKQLASGSYDGKIRVWDVETGKAMMSLHAGHDNKVWSVAFAPDGKRVASGSLDRTVRVWDLETGKVSSGPYVGHESWVMSVAFSPDGRRVASGSSDHAVRVWDVQASESASVQQHSGCIYGSILQADGWVVGPGLQLLLWVPPMQREVISVDPRCEIMGGGTKLDYHEFVHGEDWTSCKK